MTLESAIKHCEEVAEEQEKLCKVNDSFNFSQPKWKECAKEHLQLANWLRELKQLRNQTKAGHWIYGYTFPDGQYRKCSVCKELVKVVANDGNFCGHCGAKMDEIGREEWKTQKEISQSN